MTPTMHRPIPMGVRVRPISGNGYPDGLVGEVVGISCMHVIFHYIVLLDRPIDTPEGSVRAISIPGPLLENESGTLDWRLQSEEWGK